MPHYHLNIFNDEVVPDEEGVDYVDLDAARQAAITGIREMVAAHIREGKTVQLGHRIDITDDAGAVLATVRFGETVSIIG